MWEELLLKKSGEGGCSGSACGPGEVKRLRKCFDGSCKRGLLVGGAENVAAIGSSCEGRFLLFVGVCVKTSVSLN